jgi:hypothetical protein
MKNPKTLKPNVENMVIKDLQKTGKNLMLVLDRDTREAMASTGKRKSELIAAINVNLRSMSAINEVLMYYGDAGLFAENM